jgi:hypothetical protein
MMRYVRYARLRLRLQGLSALDNIFRPPLFVIDAHAHTPRVVPALRR